MVYLVVALALYMQSSTEEVLRCLLERLKWLARPDEKVYLAVDAGISRVRTRLGYEPVKWLHDGLARAGTGGASYRRWRMVSLDGSTLDVAETARNEEAFGRPAASRGRSAFPQVRFVALAEGARRYCSARA